MDKKRQLALDQLKMSKRNKIEIEEVDTDDSSAENDDETECVICGSGNCTSKNPIVLCDGPNCDIPVHKKCYGIKVVPPDDEKWLCQKCEDNASITQQSLVCCTQTDGALKRTNLSNRYVHVVCAWWNPLIDNKSDYFRIENWMIDRHTCYICNVKHGLTISCRKPDCSKRFHVKCGVQAGIVPLDTLSEVSNYDIMCEEHTPDANPQTKLTSKKSSSQVKSSKKIDQQFEPKELDISSDSDVEPQEILKKDPPKKFLPNSQSRARLFSEDESKQMQKASKKVLTESYQKQRGFIGSEGTSREVVDKNSPPAKTKMDPDFESFNVRQILNEPITSKDSLRQPDSAPKMSLKATKVSCLTQDKNRSTESVENESKQNPPVSKATSVPLDWIMDRVNSIKTLLGEIEQMPVEVTKIFKSDTPVKTNFPLDSLLSSYSTDDLNKIVDEKGIEIRALKAQIAQLQAENAKLKSSIASNSNDSGMKAAQHADLRSFQRKIVMIFSSLKLPNLTAPSLETIEEYIDGLCTVFDKARNSK